MNRYRKSGLLLSAFSLCLASCTTILASGLPQEYVTTTPVLADGVLYVASSTAPFHRGHLRAIDLSGSFPDTLWDAAERMPFAGVGGSPGDLVYSDPPAVIQVDNRYRTLFSNLAGRLLPLTTQHLARLQPAMDVASTIETELLLHALRGRLGGSAEQVAGSSEQPQRLWSISRSSPVLVGGSLFSAPRAQRDRVIYAGAEDGLLHAFFVSRWEAGRENYLIDDPDGGQELWAYLPGSFLPHLKNQPRGDSVGELAIHLDGSPVVRELFLDFNNDGRRTWHTLLAATGTIVQNRRSSLFVMDISDPYHPKLLWEKILPGDDVGRSRGVALGGCGTSSAPSACLYLTADFAAGAGNGIHALAVELATGQQLWQFTAPYSASGPVAESTPAVPALMDTNGDGKKDSLVFGDLVGQLWAVDLENGHAYGGAPAFVVPGGSAEPIGAAVAVLGSLAVFGTGGVESSDNHSQYAVYALDLHAQGSRLRWRYPLAMGEKVWEKPTLDASGNVLFGTAVDYLSLVRSREQMTSGRVVSLNRQGELDVSRDSEAATLGRVVSAPGIAVSVALTGEVTQFGHASRSADSSTRSASVKILSWRQR